MDRIVWGVLAAALVALAGFIIYLTVTNPSVPLLRGGVIVAVLAIAAMVPISKMRGVVATRPPSAPDSEEA